MQTDSLECTGCEACVAICPCKAIQMKEDKFGFLSPTIVEEKCIHCNLCEKVCPVLKPIINSLDICSYGFKNSDEAIREKSSSGGLFSALAYKTIVDGGCAVGCALDKNCRNCRHIVIDRLDELEKLRGSKYFQSQIKDVYIQIKAILETGKRVLFSGTPCQVAGLKSYLNKEYDNLLTVDFICHGVASPMVWEKYVDYEENRKKSKISSVSFRDKTTGWHGFSLKIVFDNGICNVIPCSASIYMQGFLQDLFLRNSCYRCHFKQSNYYSDITMADFWGIDEIKTELDDNKGVSLAVVHSDKGISELQEFREDELIVRTSGNDVFKRNRAYFRTPPMNLWRNKAIDEYKKKPFDKVTKKYCGLSMMAKIRRKLSRIWWEMQL